MDNYFQVLNDIDVSSHVEHKNGLSYISWATAWAEIKKKFPDTQYKIYENPDGWNYFTDGKTCWVKTGVIVNGLEHIEYLPIMDFKNKSIPLEQVTSYDVNKAIQRSLTKAVARHGLGLYIYDGEDLPEATVIANQKEAENLKKAIKSVVKAGTELMKSGFDKNSMLKIVAKYNEGNGNPSSITSVEACEEILKEFKSVMPAGETPAKKTTKSKE